MFRLKLYFKRKKLLKITCRQTASMENFSSNHKSYKELNGLQRECPDSLIPALLATFSGQIPVVRTCHAVISHIAVPGRSRARRKYSACLAVDPASSEALSALRGRRRNEAWQLETATSHAKPAIFFCKERRANPKPGGFVNMVGLLAVSSVQKNRLLNSLVVPPETANVEAFQPHLRWDVAQWCRYSW